MADGVRAVVCQDTIAHEVVQSPAKEENDDCSSIGGS